MSRRMYGSNSRYKDKPLDPQFVNVWKEALVKPVTLNLPNSRTMQRTRYKLYETRRILEANEDPIAESILRLSITTEKQPDTSYTLTIDASDNEIKQLLAKQGFDTVGNALDPNANTDADYHSPLTEEDDFLDPRK